MTTASPPKPWERAGSTGVSTISSPATSIPGPTMTSTMDATVGGTNAPALPDRPNTLNSVVNQTASNYANQSRFGANAYSSPYSSPYSRFGGYGGGYGSSMYGGGMYGSGMYGGGGGMYGSGMYGGGYGGPFGNMPGDPNNPNNQSLTQSWNQSTAATFQIMESIVGAFGGFAQMLESAYMTTHSSFFAMVSMAEQLGNLRQTLGSILGIYALLRWLRTLIAKLTGRPPPADATSLTPAAFSAFLSGGKTPATLPDGSPAPARPSKKPFIMFAIAVFGLPYLMGKLIRALAKGQEEEQKRQQNEMSLTYTNAQGEQEPIDPRKLDFCRVLYDYTPSTQSVGMDLQVKKGDLVAVLSKTDPMGNASEWWRCRARDGKVGYLPSPYLQTIQRPAPRPQQAAITQGNETSSAPGSRTTTLKGADLLEERTKSLSSVKAPAIKSKPGDITAESFQRSAFYS